MRKVILAIDSFKGCLSSKEAETAAAQGIRHAFSTCETICLPVADGGEGMQRVLTEALNGREIRLSAHDPLMQMRQTAYGLSGDGTTAFIEMAAISGLPLVPLRQRNPSLTTTYGTGELIKDALNRGCRRFVIGLGGSATNDAGLGMLQALGFRFRDRYGNELGKAQPMCGQLLNEIAFIDFSTALPALREARFTAACDVCNPFFGPEGAACVFAPQKGADPEMVAALDKGLQHLAQVIQQTTGRDIATLPGAGAAGGMGGTLSALLNAELKPGIDLLLDLTDFDKLIEGADLIITGEGKSDRQTVMGKVPSGILKRARRQGIPVILVSGSIEDADILNQAGFRAAFSITPAPMSLEEAMRPSTACRNIMQTVGQICRIWDGTSVL